MVVSLVHTSLGSSYLIAHVLHYPPPPRAQLCNRSCSNKHTHTFQRHLRSLVWVGVRVWDWIHSHTPPRTRSPSSRHPPFTHYPFPPRSLVCGGQPSPHKPRLVVSHSTCPPLSSSPHAHSFVLGTAVINNNPDGPVGIRSPHGLAPATLEFWVRFPSERNQCVMVRPVHTGLGSSSLVACPAVINKHTCPPPSTHPPPHTREQLCNRCCSNKHTHNPPHWALT